ncbi:metallopeptidase [Striga asiatica]|uniref:Metallopeptidase n=1 Tax=Striga asiatica TaxID=4170 RepID=A0A5A7PYW4_STRAF|nr:metallopeptidase [Striga asiatica]
METSTGYYTNDQYSYSSAASRRDLNIAVVIETILTEKKLMWLMFSIGPRMMNIRGEHGLGKNAFSFIIGVPEIGFYLHLLLLILIHPCLTFAPSSLLPTWDPLPLLADLLHLMSWSRWPIGFRHLSVICSFL